MIQLKFSCNVGWENMTPSVSGRFCSSCEKHVHDFSNASAEEIKAAYLANKGELCGHVPVKFLQEQHFAYHLQNSHFGQLKRFFIAAVFCFGASLFTMDAARASTIYKLKLSFLSITQSDTLLVRGIVRNKDTREQLPYAAIQAVVNNSVVATAKSDINGRYTLKIPKEFSKVDVKVILVGYDTKVIRNVGVAVGKQTVVDFDLQYEEVMYDGIMVNDESFIIDPPAPSKKEDKQSPK